MTFLKLAVVCSPSKIIIIDEGNRGIGLCVGNVLKMCVISPMRLPLDCVGTCLDKSLRCWCLRDSSVELQVYLITQFVVCNYLVLCSYNSNFYVVGLSLHCDGFLEVIVCLLFSPEAWNFMIIHCIHLLAQFWNVLHEPNHSFIARCVKFLVISCRKCTKFVSSVYNRIFGDFLLKCIFKIGQESQSILELYLKWLIINCGPSSRKVLGVTLATRFTVLSFSLVLIHEFDPINIFTFKLPFMVLANNLQFIW